jgi:TrmH family RNA methyltransferase
VITVWPLPTPKTPLSPHSGNKGVFTGSACVYLHGVGDPGNVGAIVRTADALVDGPVVLGPDCADPFSPKAVRASMGSIFGQPVAEAGLGETPRPRVALLAHGGDPLSGLEPPLTVCLGAERTGLPPEVSDACEQKLTIPLRRGAESLNVAAAAAIVLQRISSPTPGAGPAVAARGEIDG